MDPPPSTTETKLRLMCSYGGHIMPRPHDKVLTYMGGETRLVVIDRISSLSSLCYRLSKTLENCRSFTLKYQLPDEDLDSLVSITTDEDLENMVEEYDRINTSSRGRLRLFVFINKLETAATMGSLLNDAKCESWFVDALNGSGLLPRGLSDSATHCLVNLDGRELGRRHNNNNNNNTDNDNDNNSNKEDDQAVQLSVMADSPMVETNTSSIGSSSSTPSTLNNLPPVQVYNRVLSDDERSDPGVQLGHRKPPLPLPLPLQLQSRHPDSLASSDLSSRENSFSKPIYYQDQVHVVSNKAAESPPPAVPQIQVQDSGYTTLQHHLDQNHPLHQQQQQQQQQNFVQHHPSMQYLPPHQPNSQYYPVYTQHHQPIYLMHQQPPQQYMSMQSSNIVEDHNIIGKNGTPPLYPSKAAKPEMVPIMYKTTAGNLVQTGNQFQQQFVGYSQMQHPPTPIDYVPNGEQIYYSHQHQPSEYQTMTPAAAIAALADASAHLAQDVSTTTMN